jgi:transmembrane sensor
MKSAMTKRDETAPMSLHTGAADDEAAAGLDPIQREAYDWIARFMGGNMTASDVARMKAWYGQSPVHSRAYAEARRVWNTLGPVANARMRESADAEAAGRARSYLSAPIARRALIGGALAAAAAYAFVKPPLDIWPSYSELMADYRTGPGEQRQVKLAGTTSLDINTRTSIALRAQTADMTQVELISGEAAFSTGMGSTELTVVAASGRIVAIRSDFNLRCDGSEVSITCLSGGLTVLRGGAATPLGAGQQLRYGDREIGSVTAVDPENVTAWRHGNLIFDGEPVADVIAEINRYRTGRIVLMNEEIGRRLLTARLRTTDTDKIVTQVVHIFGAKARTLPGGIVVLT